jgi:hypothetical protein
MECEITPQNSGESSSGLPILVIQIGDDYHFPAPIKDAKAHTNSEGQSVLILIKPEVVAITFFTLKEVTPKSLTAASFLGKQ